MRKNEHIYRRALCGGQTKGEDVKIQKKENFLAKFSFFLAVSFFSPPKAAR